MFLKSDDKYIHLGAAVEGAQRWFDCNKISYPELYFEEIYAPKRAHLAVVMDYQGELLGEVPIDVTFAYTERAFLHLRSRAWDYREVDKIPCSEIQAGQLVNLRDPGITFLQEES